MGLNNYHRCFLCYIPCLIKTPILETITIMHTPTVRWESPSYPFLLFNVFVPSICAAWLPDTPALSVHHDSIISICCIFARRMLCFYMGGKAITVFSEMSERTHISPNYFHILHLQSILGWLYLYILSILPHTTHHTHTTNLNSILETKPSSVI